MFKRSRIKQTWTHSWGLLAREVAQDPVWIRVSTSLVSTMVGQRSTPGFSSLEPNGVAAQRIITHEWDAGQSRSRL
jgi:hypothetical protein